MPKRKGKEPRRANIFPKQIKRDHDHELHSPTISQEEAFSMKNYNKVLEEINRSNFEK